MRERSRVVSMWLTLVAAACLPATWMVLQATEAHAADAQDRYSIATIGVPKDAASSAGAAVAARAARQAINEDVTLNPLDLVQYLEDGRSPSYVQQYRQAEEALRRGRAAFDALELVPAQQSFTEAQVGFEQAIAASESVAKLVESLVWQGAAATMLRDKTTGKKSFERALVLDDNAQLPAGVTFSKDVTTLFDEVVKARASLAQGTLTIYSSPPAAEVWVDGVFRGAAPLVLNDIPVGRHMVRLYSEGYVAFGAAAEVAKGRDGTVQGNLRPCARFAEFDEKRRRIAQGAPSALRDMAVFLRVDLLLAAVTQTSNDSITVVGSMTDGIVGNTFVEQNKTFNVADSGFRGDLRRFIVDNFQRARPSMQAGNGGSSGNGGNAGNSGNTGNTGNGKNGEGGQFLPAVPKEVPVPPTVTAGWTVLGLSAIPFAVGIGSGAYSLYAGGVYRSLDSQLHPQLNEVYNLYFTTSLVADIGYVLGIGMATTGGVLLWMGYNEKANIEDVLDGNTGGNAVKSGGL